MLLIYYLYMLGYLIKKYTNRKYFPRFINTNVIIFLDAGMDYDTAEGLSAGSITGITIFVVAFLAIIIVIFITRRSKKRTFKALDGLELPATDSLRN